MAQDKLRPLCLTCVSVLLGGLCPEHSCWVMGFFDWLSIRENPQQVSLFIWVWYLLPATVSAHEGLTVMVYGITLLINIKLWQVKIWGLLVIVSDCKNVFKATYGQALIHNKIFSLHKVWFLPNRLWGRRQIHQQVPVVTVEFSLAYPPFSTFILFLCV